MKSKKEITKELEIYKEALLDIGSNRKNGIACYCLRVGHCACCRADAAIAKAKFITE